MEAPGVGPAVCHERAALAHTTRLASALVALLEPGDLVALVGGLGAGKTAFVRAACAALGVPREAGVKSPTFALIHLYEGGVLPVAHLDLYRLGDPDELEALGFRDLLEGDHVLFVEWPERAPDLLGMADVTVNLGWAQGAPNARSLRVTAPDAALLRGLARSLGARAPEPPSSRPPSRPPSQPEPQ